MRITPAPISFVYGNCVMSGEGAGAWALFAVPTTSYTYLTLDRKRELFGRLMGALETVEADLQILRVSTTWDVEDYVRRLSPTVDADPRRVTEGKPNADGRAAGHSGLLDWYLHEHARRLASLDPAVPSVYIAVRLAMPETDVASFLSRAFEAHPREWLRALRRQLAWGERGAFAASQLEALRVAADRAHARLADFLDVRPASGVELQWLVRRSFCRGLGEPEVDGLHEPQALVFERNGEAVLAPLEADVLRWLDSYVEHRGRSLCLESERGTGWQAQLVLGALPERADFPSERVELMSAVPEQLPFPVDLVLTCRFLPNELALRIARRRVQDADQILRAEAEGDQGASDKGYERTQEARDLVSYLQSSSRPPLLKATIAIAVSGRTEDELQRRVELCRRAYGEVRLHRPLGDQLELFCQHLPGQPTRVRGYDDVLTPEQAAALMPIATHLAGSDRGFYLGHTLTGSRQPVRFNLSEGSDRDRNTAILSIGALGSGKTTLDQKLKYEGFLQGARIIDCDPKGDHRFHLLADVAPHAETIALSPDQRLRGLLDPLRVAPEHLRQDAAVAFLLDLLPVRREPAWETAVIKAVDAVHRRAPRPTCLEVIRALQDGHGVDAEVARILAVYARGGLTQLGFADADVKLPELGAKQVTYIPIRDLPAPQPGVPRTEYSQAERLGEQIVRLIAMFAMHLLARERQRLKLFSFDEGWRLLKDPIGRMLLASLQRMGRSELAVPIISTQLVTDAMTDERESLENLVGATFVFGMRSEREAARALQLLGLDPEDRALRARLLDFDAGRCLFRDHNGRVEAIQVDLVIPDLLRELSTTPDTASALAGR